jgi:hypothetical protein
MELIQERIGLIPLLHPIQGRINPCQILKYMSVLLSHTGRHPDRLVRSHPSSRIVEILPEVSGEKVFPYRVRRNETGLAGRKSHRGLTEDYIFDVLEKFHRRAGWPGLGPNPDRSMPLQD